MQESAPVPQPSDPNGVRLQGQGNPQQETHAQGIDARKVREQAQTEAEAAESDKTRKKKAEEEKEEADAGGDAEAARKTAEDGTEAKCSEEEEQELGQQEASRTTPHAANRPTVRHWNGLSIVIANAER